MPNFNFICCLKMVDLCFEARTPNQVKIIEKSLDEAMVTKVFVQM